MSLVGLLLAEYCPRAKVAGIQLSMEHAPALDV